MCLADRSVLAALCLGLGLATPVAAQPDAAALMPAPQVARVQTIGSWTGSDGRGGDIRLVLLDQGFEDTAYASFVTWSLRDFDMRRFDTVRTVALPDCGGEGLGYVVFEAFDQPSVDGPVRLSVRATDLAGGLAGRPLEYDIGLPGEIALRSGCR